MTTDTRRKPLPGWETSPFARRTERAARMICGAAFPGIFLGSAFAGTMELLEYGSGLFGIPGVSLIIIALEAIFGAVLVGSWRERHGLRGILILPALLLFLFSLVPGPRAALAICGILAGGYFTALPVRSGGVRAVFGVSFALTVFLLPGHAFAAQTLQIALFPILFASTILWVGAHWVLRVCMIALLPVSTILFAEGMLNRRPAVSAGEPQEVAAALPAILMANSDSARVLFLSDRPSLLPEVWCSMPFVAGVESIWPQAERFPGRDWSKFKPHNGLPGRAVAALAGKFNLIYIDTFPSGGEAARRGFVEKLWELLEPKNGILVLPSVNRLLLPAEAQWAVLPGTRGQRVAASREAVSTDLDLLDGRLRALLEPFGEENHIPAGIFAALYYTPSPPVLPAPENDPAFAKPVSPEWFYETLFCFLLGYGAIRLYFGRYGRNPYGFALMENSAGFVLVLLAACSAMSCRELFTGVPASTIWGCVGLVFVVLPLRARAARVLALAAIVLPAVWLIPQSLIVEEPTWIIVTAVAALAAGAVRGRIGRETAFPRSWCTTFSAAGWIVGGAVYAVFHLLLREPLLPALIVAGALRLAWPLKL